MFSQRRSCREVGRGCAIAGRPRAFRAIEHVRNDRARRRVDAQAGAGDDDVAGSEGLARRRSRAESGRDEDPLRRAQELQAAAWRVQGSRVQAIAQYEPCGSWPHGRSDKVSLSFAVATQRTSRSRHLRQFVSSAVTGQPESAAAAEAVAARRLSTLRPAALSL